MTALKAGLGLVCLTGIAIGLIPNDLRAQNAPPAPRPFTVTNPDGTTQVVNPDRGNARLSVQKDDVPTTAPKQPEPFFRTELSPREVRKAGYYAAALVGFNVDAYRGNDFASPSFFDPFLEGTPQIFGGADNNMEIGPMVSLKFGYLWPFGQSIDQFENETGGLHLAGALEAEFLYFHSFHEVATPNGTVDVDQATLSPLVNFILKGAWGRSQAYVGMGVGIGNSLFDSDSFDPATGFFPDNVDGGNFAYQFLAGYEFQMNTDWSLFTEAKYFNQSDADLVPIPGGNGNIANILVGIGVKRTLF